MIERQKGNERLLMSVDGEWREIDMNLLSERVVEKLEMAYDHSKVVGFGKTAFIDTSNILADRIAKYSKVCAQLGNKEMSSSRIFAIELGLNWEDNPLMVDGLLWVDANILENPDFGTRDINICNLKRDISDISGNLCSYSRMATKFNKWKEGHFLEGLYVGFVKFLKFYYIVAKTFSKEKFSIAMA